MTFPSPLICSCCLFFAATIATGLAQEGAGAIAAGKAHLEGRKPEAALAEFQKAMAAAPAQHEGYFFAAVASYRLGNLAAAEEYAKVALEKAPESEKAKVQEVLGVIADKQKFEKLDREGDEAMTKGLRAKAAERYREAYILFPKDGRPGLKAAALYADRLERPVDAAILWQQVAAQADEASRAEARSELSKRYLELDKLLKSELYAAKTTRRKEAEKVLEQLCLAFPDRIEPHMDAAEFYAAKGKYEKAIEHFSRASALGVEAKDVQFREGLLFGVGYNDGAGLRTFIEEAFGATVLEKMRQIPTIGSRSTPRVWLLEEAASQGYAWAMRELGDVHAARGMIDRNPDAYKEAVRWYQKAVDLGNPEAMASLGNCYSQGHGVSEDPSVAIALFQRATALGETNGFWYWGVLEEDRNTKEAERIWLLGADAGNVHSMNELAEFYRKNGQYEKAMAIAKRLIEGPDAFPAFGWSQLAHCYQDGPAPIKNLEEAKRCIAELKKIDEMSAKLEFGDEVLR